MLPPRPSLQSLRPCLHWFLIRGNRAALIPSWGRLLILPGSRFRNRFTIPPIDRTFTSSLRSVLVRSSMSRSCASPSASSSPAGERVGIRPGCSLQDQTVFLTGLPVRDVQVQLAHLKVHPIQDSFVPGYAGVLVSNSHQATAGTGF